MEEVEGCLLARNSERSHLNENMTGREKALKKI